MTIDQVIREWSFGRFALRSFAFENNRMATFCSIQFRFATVGWTSPLDILWKSQAMANCAHGIRMRKRLFGTRISHFFTSFQRDWNYSDPPTELVNENLMQTIWLCLMCMYSIRCLHCVWLTTSNSDLILAITKYRRTSHVPMTQHIE